MAELDRGDRASLVRRGRMNGQPQMEGYCVHILVFVVSNFWGCPVARLYSGLPSFYRRFFVVCVCDL